MASNNSPYFIAVIDTNHNGDMALAKELIDAARKCGVDAVKFHKRSAPDLFAQQYLDETLLKYPSYGKTYREVFETLEFSVDELETLIDYAGTDLEVIAAPQDITSLGELHKIKLDRYQIDASLVAHAKRLKSLVGYGNLLLDVSYCSHKELESILKTWGSKNATFIQRLWMDDLIHLKEGFIRVAWLKEKAAPFGVFCQGHDIRAALIALSWGASVIEMRITISRELEGPYHAQSMLPGEIARVVSTIKDLGKAISEEAFQNALLAEGATLFDDQPSLVAKQPIAKGETITREMLASKLPSVGLSPAYIDFVVGKQALYDIAEDQFITFGNIAP